MISGPTVSVLGEVSSGPTLGVGHLIFGEIISSAVSDGICSSFGRVQSLSLGVKTPVLDGDTEEAQIS